MKPIRRSLPAIVMLCICCQAALAGIDQSWNGDFNAPSTFSGGGLALLALVAVLGAAVFRGSFGDRMLQTWFVSMGLLFILSFVFNPWTMVAVIAGLVLNYLLLYWIAGFITGDRRREKRNAEWVSQVLKESSKATTLPGHQEPPPPPARSPDATLTKAGSQTGMPIQKVPPTPPSTRGPEATATKVSTASVAAIHNSPPKPPPERPEPPVTKPEGPLKTVPCECGAGNQVPATWKGVLRCPSCGRLKRVNLDAASRLR